MTAQRKLRYVIISPVRDEERYIEGALRSVTGQTHKPEIWVIVDDGSRDRTREIVNRYTSAHTFIRVIETTRDGPREPGGGVVRAFNHGLPEVSNLEFDVIVKLDCDLTFESDYFEKLLVQFERNPRLGICSGVYSEQSSSGSWHQVPMPWYHAAGACKAVRKACWTEIDGFVACRGWDTIDELRARSRGWDTQHCADLRMLHHKPEGSGVGSKATNIMLGEIFYRTRGSLLFFAIKLLDRSRRKPVGTGALAMLWGYLRAAARRMPPLVTEIEGREYRKLLRARLWGSFRRAN